MNNFDLGRIARMGTTEREPMLAVEAPAPQYYFDAPNETCSRCGKPLAYDRRIFLVATAYLTKTFHQVCYKEYMNETR